MDAASAGSIKKKVLSNFNIMCIHAPSPVILIQTVINIHLFTANSWKWEFYCFILKHTCCSEREKQHATKNKIFLYRFSSYAFRVCASIEILNALITSTVAGSSSAFTYYTSTDISAAFISYALEEA